MPTLPRQRWRPSHNCAMSPARNPRIVIIGCGFGGLEAARTLRAAPVEITLVDRTNHHLFQPLLYQVATAGLSAPAIAAPVRHLFRRQPNLTTLLGEATAIDVAARQVHLADGSMPALRPPDRRGRRHAQLFRARRVGDVRARPEDAGRRVRDPAAHPAGIRGRREGARSRAPRRLAELRGHRRRTHRRGDGGHDGRDRPPHAARRIPAHRSCQRQHHPAGRRLRGCCRPCRKT